VRLWRFLQSQRPLPLFAARDIWKRFVAIIIECSAGRIRPLNFCSEELHDLPLRKESLRLFGIGELERAEQETFGLKFI
jgi:hypothetical protein